ncbi:deubiquitinating enzyme [Dimargaris cristalligena]|uniref:Ubiquitin carboxyl-terminal hydrolase n=1 Tax=Dimargaris cristalligena TaxID=215637 RepID=A0A4P9ZK29_9FUNG|nr:deubiquitinating enzyme [Dimargaris cristalligena]RKP33616.1 hypothetical protein BJ085DRAFT_40714 [Dimargaris cristalligena]|eukprot:RKP33616.1 hypothetical protein BJ085DRAFT_40714 [Dimargaris cristalligena]
MSPIKVNVKWSGQKFDNIELDPQEPALTFKTQLFSLTGVQPERQKIFVKGGMLKDDTDLASLHLTDGHTFMMMGTAGELPKVPEKKVMFVEDMSEKQLQTAYSIPSGLQNLGNTCYLNATLQCMRVIPELRQSLAQFTGGINQGSPAANLTAALRDLYKELDRSSEGYPPLVFLQLFFALFPQFGERDRHNALRQHDAEECWTQLFTAMREQLGQTTSSSSSTPTPTLEKLTMGKMEVTIQCDDNPEEPPQTMTESFAKLSCHISKDTNFLPSGIAAALTEKIQKRSPSLDRDATYTRRCQITRLPAYLTVNFVRFFWKASEQVNSKILRKVTFPTTFDATSFCHPDLVARMRPVREAIREAEEKTALEKKLKKQTSGQSDAMQVDGADGQTGSTGTLPEPSPKFELDSAFKQDPGCNPSGQYDLCAVLTHIGRSSDEGHYVAWIRKDNSDEWYKYDDDRVSIVKEAEIMRLSGGGDWHTAYICLYRAKDLPA